MSDDELPKRATRRSRETGALERVLEKQVRRVEENPTESAERRAAAGELRRLTETMQKPTAPDSKTE